MSNLFTRLNRAIYNRRIHGFKKSTYGQYLKKRRFAAVNNALNGRLTNTSRAQRVIEIGVGYGVDFVKIAAANAMLELYGLDIEDNSVGEQFTFVKGDADNIVYPDNYFDIAVSFGVLEHIQPIEKLAAAIRELTRVSCSYCVVVPAVSTFFEPHMASFFWQLRDRNKKPRHPVGWLNYFSDEAWLQFEGFAGASTKRIKYMPCVTQLLIYKN